MVDPFMSSSWEAVSYHLTVDAFFFYKILYRLAIPGKIYHVFTSCNPSVAFILYFCKSALSIENSGEH